MKIFSLHLICFAVGGALLTFSCLNVTAPQEEARHRGSSLNVTVAPAADLSDDQNPSTQTQAVDPKKMALIVAISHYDPETGWINLSSMRDASLVKAALATQGFDTVQNVAILQDQKATRTGITEAIQNHLIDKVQAGSIVVFHYSGHGQQVFDNNGEELDGYDEALVAYDAPMKAQGKYEGYSGDKHMRDDELGALLNKVRKKIGASGDLMVVLDACHSGTATRGIGKARGTFLKIAPEGYGPSEQSRGQNDDWLDISKDKDLAPMVVLSGASANELNYEAQDEQGNWVGPLSYAFSRTLTGADANTSYQGLFDKIKVDMSALAPRQSPQIEGEVDRQILGGKAVPQQNHFTVKVWFDDRNLSIDAGQLFGLFERSEVAFYDIDTRDTTGIAPKATGIIVASYFLESDVALDHPLSKKEAKNSWVFVKNKNFGDLQVKIKLNIQDHAPFEKALKRAFDKAPLIQLTNDDPELMVEMNNEYTRSRGANALQIITTHDYVLFQTSVSDHQVDATAEEVTRQAISFAQANFLRKLTLEEPSLKVVFEIIPIEVGGRRKVEVARIPIEEKMDENGALVLNDGDHFKLRIINHGIRKAYYCMLDIQPDNKINPMIPDSLRTPEEYFIEAKDTVELNEIFEVYKPYGTENFKLIATHEPMDIRPIVTHRGAPPASKGLDNMHPLEKLLLESYKSEQIKDRGSSTVSVPPSSGNIETLVFRIAKAD